MADIINPSSTGMTHNADVYWHYSGDPVQRSQLLGTFTIGAPQKVLLPIPADADIVLRCVPRGGRGQGFMAGPGDATPHTMSALGVGTGGGTSNFYQGLRVNHGYSYGTTPTPRPILNLLQSFQVKDDSVFGESDLSTFGVPTGMLNLRTDKNASGVGGVTTGTIAAGALTTLTLAARLDLQPGMGIYIAGAGSSGGALITTVTSNSEDGLTLQIATAASAPVTAALVQGDDTAAVQAWISAKGDLAMPPGYYRITSSILFPPVSEGFSIIIHGSGWDQSQFAFQNVGDGFVTDISNPANLRFDSIVFKDCTVATATIGDPSGTVSSTNRGHGFRLTAPDIYGIYDQLVLERVRVIGWGRFGIWSDNLEVSWLHDCIFRLNKSGHVAFIAPDEIGPNKQPNANVIDSCTFDQAFSDPATHRTGTGSMTAGSNVLTVSGTSLTAADRGRAVIVQGGGTSGSFIYSFIDVVISSSQAQLTYNAQSGASGVPIEILATNIASIFLNRANDTTISGATIQGNFAKDSTGANVATPLTNDVNAIRADECGNLRIVGVHEEDNAGAGGAAIRLARCQSVTIENYGGTSGDPVLRNAHGYDIQLINSHAVRVSQCFFNDRPQFVVDDVSTEIEIDNSLVVGHNNIWQHDSSWDRVTVGSGVHTYQRANQLTNQLGGAEYIYDSLFGRDLLRNGRFIDGVGGLEGWTNSQPTWWTNPFTSLTRFGSYVRLNSTAIADNGGVGMTVLNQTVAIPDSLPGGQFCLAFDWYIENEAGSSSVSSRYTEVRLHPSSGIDEALQWVVRGFTYVQQRWWTAQMHCFLNAGTGRTIDVQIRATPGPNNVIIRLANLRLSAGKHSFGSYERAVHDFGGRMRAPLELMAISSVNYPAPPTTGQDSSMISLVNIAGTLNVGKAGVYSPITTGSSSGHVIQDETVALAAEPVLNFTGSGIRAVDNPIAGNPRTDVFVVAATPTQEGTVSTAVQSFAGTKTFGDGLVAQLPSGAVSGTHIQEWRISSGGSVIAWLDTQPILRLGAPSVIDGFLELASGGGASTIKLAAAVTPTAAQTLRFPAAFPTAGNVLSVASAATGIVTLAWSTASTGHTIMEEGGALIQRGNLNFVGQGITAADVAGNTQVTLNAATQTTEGIVSTVAQNFGGLKTFFAGAIMQGTGVSQPVLTVQGQGASGSVHIQEWKDSGGVFSVGYFTLDAQLRIGNPNVYTGWLELCSQSSGNTTKFVCATTPAVSLVYVWPANTPAATQVLGVSSIAGSTVTMAWQTGGSGSGVGGNGTLNQLARWSSSSIPGTLTDAGIADNGTSIILQRSMVMATDGTLNIGDGTNRVGAIYLKNAFFVYTTGSTSSSPHSAGFLDPPPGEYSRLLISGNAHVAQSGNGQRLQFTSYHSFEFRGNRRSTTAPAFTTISGTDSSGVLIYQELTDVIPLLVNTSTTITSDLFHCQNASVSKFRVSTLGTTWMDGGIRNNLFNNITSTGAGQTFDLSNYFNYYTLIMDCFAGSFTFTLPVLTAAWHGFRYRLICRARSTTNTVTIKCGAGNDINETGFGGTTGVIMRPNTAGLRDLVLVADYNNSQWWIGFHSN